MKAADTRSSNSITGVYDVNTFTIYEHKYMRITTLATHHVYSWRRLHIYWSQTCAVLRTVHKLQIAWASAWVFLLICRSCAACLSGSRVSFVPQDASFLSVSHSCSCQTLYLKPETSLKELSKSAAIRPRVFTGLLGPTVWATVVDLDIIFALNNILLL